MTDTSGPKALAKLFMEQGVQLTVERSFRILVHDVNSVLFIEEGDVDLFALEPRGELVEALPTFLQEMATGTKTFLGDLIEGPLTFLQNIPNKQLLFPFPLYQETDKPKIVAIANEQVKIRKLPIEALWKAQKQSQEICNEISLQVATWTLSLSMQFAEYKQQLISKHVDIDQTAALNAGDIIKMTKHVGADVRSSVGWLQVTKGSLHLLNKQELAINANDPCFPMIPSTWLRCASESEVAMFDNDGVVQRGLYWDGLQSFHAHLLNFLVMRKHQIEDKEVVDAHVREEMEGQLLDVSLRNIGSVLAPYRKIEMSQGEDRLLAACQRIGNVLDLQFVARNKEVPCISLEDQVYQTCLSSRVQYRKVLLGKNWWMDTGKPLLAFLTDGMIPVALIPSNKGTFEYLDPISLQMVTINAEEAAKLDSTAYMFYRSFSPTVALNAITLALFSVRGRAFDIGLIVALGLFGSILGIFGPYANKVLFDDVIPTMDTSLLLQVCLALFALTIFSTLLSMTRAYTMLRLESLVDHDLQAAIWDRVLALPAKFFRRYPVGDLIQRVYSIDSMRKMLSGSVMGMFLNSLFSIVYTGVMLYYSPQLALVGFGIVSISIMITAYSLYRSITYQRTALKLGALLNSKVIQLIFGISKIRTTGVENRIFASWAKDFATAESLGLTIGNVQNVINIMESVVTIIAQAAIFGTAMMMMEAASGSGETFHMTMGTFLAFNAAYQSFSGAILGAAGTLMGLVEIFPLWERNKALLQESLEVGREKYHPGQLTGELSVDHLSFRYEAGGPLVLEDISIKANPGEFVAIVGPSGCGKSTLIRLLIGFEHPEQGGVFYDGKDVSSLDLRELRRQLGVVLQTSAILEGSIKDNIITGGNYTDEQVQEAIRLAGFSEDLAQLPMGLHTVMTSGGGTLSGGQRQRLLIARSLIGNPKILVFDEATSALDNITQRIVSDNLERLDVTRLVVAHRISTIKNADRIYVFQHGKVAQQGTYNELLNTPGLFAEMASRQAL